MHVLILGLGRLGQALAKQCVSDGHQVTGVKRTPIDPIDGVTLIYSDLLSLDLSSATPIDRVYIILTPDQRSAEAYRHTYIAPIKSVVDQLKHHPIGRVVLVSSTAVCGLYQPNQNNYIDELSPLKPVAEQQKQPFNAHVLYQAEVMWRQAVDSVLGSTTELVVIRPSGIYDQHRKRLLNSLTATESPFSQQQLSKVSHRIHADDVVSFLFFLLTAEGVDPLYIVTDNLAQPLYQTLLGLCTCKGIAPPDWLASYLSTDPQISVLYQNQRMQHGGFALQYPTWETFYCMQY